MVGSLIHKSSKNLLAPFKILRRYKDNVRMFHTQESQMSGVIVQNLAAQVTRCPRLLLSWMINDKLHKIGEEAVVA